MIIITVDYRCIPGFNRNHQARTVRGACIDHPTRKYPQFKQDISVEHAAGCEVPSLPCDAVILPLMGGAPDATAIPGDSGNDSSATFRPAPKSLRQCLSPAMPFWGCSSACISRGVYPGIERCVKPATGSAQCSRSWFVLSIQKHTGLSTAALESTVNSLALVALSTETVCRLGAHTANPQVVTLKSLP